LRLLSGPTHARTGFPSTNYLTERLPVGRQEPSYGANLGQPTIRKQPKAASCEQSRMSLICR
jgi:hypothetical protein